MRANYIPRRPRAKTFKESSHGAAESFSPGPKSGVGAEGRSKSRQGRQKWQC